MAWPPSAPSVGYQANGYTTIVWGTNGFQQGDITNYIVKSVRPSQRIEEHQIENGTGLTATKILLNDGYDYEVTVVDDTTVTPPAVGGTLGLITPFTSGQINFLVVNNSYNAARKQEGERVLLCRSFTLFAL